MRVGIGPRTPARSGEKFKPSRRSDNETGRAQDRPSLEQPSMRIFWPVDGRRRLLELLVASSGRADGANPRVGLALISRKQKPAIRDAGTAKMTPAQLDGGAWLSSHPRSPKAARSTPARAYHPPAR